MILRKGKSISRIVLGRILGFSIFLLLLYFIGNLSFITKSPVNVQIINWLFENLWLILLFTIVFLFGELFDAFVFPFNLPAPILNAMGSLFLLVFLFRLFGFLEVLLGFGFFWFFEVVAFLIYPVVFVLVLIVGYVRIFTSIGVSEGSEKDELGKKPFYQRFQNVSCDDEHGSGLTWEEVGLEFKRAVFDLISLVRESINDKRSKK